MALELHTITKVVVASSCVQYCCAQDHFGWYSQWYLWFAIAVMLVICCGVLGRCLRRGKIQREYQNRRAAVVSIELHNDHRRENQPQIYYLPGSSPPSSQTVVYQVPHGSSVPRQPIRQPPDGNLMSPPPYEQVTDKQVDINDLPTYQEAIRQPSGYVNPAATLTEDEGVTGRSRKDANAGSMGAGSTDVDGNGIQTNDAIRSGLNAADVSTARGNNFGVNRADVEKDEVNTSDSTINRTNGQQSV